MARSAVATKRSGTPSKNAWYAWPLAVQSFSLESYDVLNVIRIARDLGVKYIEFFHGHISPRSSREQMKSVKDALKEAGMQASAYGLYLFNSDRSHNEKAFEFASVLGVKNITGEIEPKAFDGIQRLAEQYRIRVALHTSGPGSRYAHLETLLSDLKGTSQYLGACIDTGHILRSAQDPAKWIDALPERVFVVHLTDVADVQAQTYSKVLGTGHLDLQKILAALERGRFAQLGSISVGFRSYHCARLRDPEGDPIDVVAALADSLKQLA